MLRGSIYLYPPALLTLLLNILFLNARSYHESRTNHIKENPMKINRVKEKPMNKLFVSIFATLIIFAILGFALKRLPYNYVAVAAAGKLLGILDRMDDT